MQIWYKVYGYSALVRKIYSAFDIYLKKLNLSKF